MRAHAVCLTLLAFVSAASTAAQVFETVDTAGMSWYKGNLHTHTTLGPSSDSDSTAEEEALWYRAHGYDFVVFTDHNLRARVAELQAGLGPDFLAISGDEVTTSVHGVPVHIGALGIGRYPTPWTNPTVLETIQQNVDEIRGASGVPVINHPNTSWAVDANDLLAVSDCCLFEVCNCAPGSARFNPGDAKHASLEQVWDLVLSAGKRLYGVAADDAGHFKNFASDKKNPGRGWVVVRSGALDEREILRNLDSGLFYASTGVAIEDIVIEPMKLSIAIDQADGGRFHTEFIGARGSVLLETDANPAVYSLSGEELYVRAVVADQSGRKAWIQPVFVKRP